jgi:integrase
MLRTEGRATTGAVGILRALSAMAEDAITDEVCDLNPFKGVRIRANDPRAKKKPRPIRVFTFEEMHRFAKAAGRYEAMVRVFTDCGLRLGEVLPLRREDFDGETLQVRRTAHEGQILEGTKTDHGEPDPGRVVPAPATLAWMLEAQINLNGPGCQLLFPTPRGRLWRERTFYRDLWKPTQEASGLDIRPHECRHSYVTHLRAAGVNDADLAEIVGHRVETMLARYTHPVGTSFDSIRAAVDKLPVAYFSERTARATSRRANTIAEASSFVVSAFASPTLTSTCSNASIARVAYSPGIPSLLVGAPD